MIFHNKHDGGLLEVDEKQVLQVYRQGGGFVVKMSLFDLLNNYRRAPASEPYGPLTRSWVQLNDDPVEMCWMSKQRWNGWAIPYFTAVQFMELHKDLLKTYHHRTNRIVLTEDGDDTSIEGVTMPDGSIGYPSNIGWCWQALSDEEVFTRNLPDTADKLNEMLAALSHTWAEVTGTDPHSPFRPTDGEVEIVKRWLFNNRSRL